VASALTAVLLPIPNGFGGSIGTAESVTVTYQSVTDQSVTDQSVTDHSSW